MTSKTIKNEQWYVKDLVARINNGEIYKPKFQRKRKWDIQPKKETVPSERNYIDFLRDTKNSVHPITFGLSLGKYTNIDGNNRINAIIHFINSPFDLYPEYFVPIDEFINAITSEIPAQLDKKNIGIKLRDIFINLTYLHIMDFKYNKYFITTGESELYKTYLQSKRDLFEDILDELQHNLSNGSDRFDNNITINVNIFEGYTTEELCNIFSKINKYSSALTARELLASTLFTKTDFVIEDKSFEATLRQILFENYSKMHHCESEILELYTFDDAAPLNAYDFITGFELIAYKTCKIISNQFTETTGLSVLFKVFSIMYGGINEQFTKANINDFIIKINATIKILQKLESMIATANITSISAKTFDICHKKLSSLRTNSQTILILGIVGHINNPNISEKDTLKSAERCLMFHLMFKEINNKEDKDKYYRDNVLNINSTSGAYVIELCNKVYKTPRELDARVTKQKMSEILDILISENINIGAPSKNRKSRKFWEGTLIHYYYKRRMPQLYLDNKYWIEHIFPFSSTIDGDTNIDIDRLGNIIPIIDTINSKRGTKHISEYAKIKEGKEFIKHVSDIIPSTAVYDTIITHSALAIPKIINACAYSALCLANEKTYRDIFLDQLFSN